MPKVPYLAIRKAQPHRTVPEVRRSLASGEGREKQPAIPAEETSRKTGTRAEGIAACLAPAIAAREGCRILVYGRTRWGKSSFARHLVDAAPFGGWNAPAPGPETGRQRGGKGFQLACNRLATCLQLLCNYRGTTVRLRLC